MEIAAAFDESINYYDKWVRIALPSYDELFESALAAMPFAPELTIEVLDLGAGTGLFSMEVSRKYPSARFTLMDVAEKMLNQARRRFTGDSRFSFVTGDCRELSTESAFDAVISSLSIHHLTHREKQLLFRAVNRSLRPGGIFVNVDQVRAPTEELSAHYWAKWLAHVRSNGANEEQIEASVSRRQEHDKDASLVEQLSWLENAGLANVDCVYKNWFVGVFVAAKPT